MVSRPAWNGHLKLSLVTAPVALFPALGDGDDVRFNLINEPTGNRIRMIPTDPDTGPVERSSLVKGYHTGSGYVILTDEEIRSARPESAKTINVERFVPASEINRLYWEKPYYLAPDGAMAVEAFSVIREAMRTAGQIAMGRVVIANRERLVALEPEGKGIVAHTLRTRDEVRPAGEVFDQIPDTPMNPAMLEIARQIVAQHAGQFDPAQFVDSYTAALRAIIERKQIAEAPNAKSVSEAQVVDLMAALKASLGPPPRTARTRAAAAAAPAAPKITSAARSPRARKRRTADGG